MWSGTHLLEVINDIQDVSKIEAGELALRHEPVDLRLLFDEFNRMFSERLQHGQLELTTEVKTPIETIPADSLRLKQALFNLLGNSVKFTAAGGIIKMTAGETADGHVEIAIADSGIGIAQADLKKCFNRSGRRAMFTIALMRAVTSVCISSNPLSSYTAASSFSKASPVGARQSPCGFRSKG
jgi:signal transduction histidine kinase